MYVLPRKSTLLALALALIVAPAARAQFNGGSEYGGKPKTSGLGLGGIEKPGSDENRLGIRASSPNALLIKQLNLPKDQGVCIERVGKDSAAEKAGLQQYDILLQLDGKPVPSDAVKFTKFVADLKPDMAVEAVVIREGKQQTIKGLVVPSVKSGK